MLGEDYDVLMAVYRYKKRSGELGEITGDVGLRMAATNLEDGFRLTIWAYDRQEVYLSVFSRVQRSLSTGSILIAHIAVLV